MSQIDDFLSGKLTQEAPSSIDEFLGVAPKKKRRDVEDMTVGSVAQDIASGVLQIVPTAVKGVADIARLATGDRVGTDTSNRMERDMETIRKDYGSDRAAAQRENFQADMADDSVGIGEAMARNKGALADQLLPTIGSMFLPVGVAGVAGKLATVGKAAQAMDKATLVARVASAQQAAGVGAVAAQNAADTFAQLLEKGAPMSDAYLGAGITVPFSVIAGRLTGGGAEGAITRALTGGAAAKAGVKQLGTAMLKEGGQEMGEEAGQITGEAVAMGEAPSAMSAAKQMAVAGTLGAAMGGGVDVATQFSGAGQQAQAPGSTAVTPPSQPVTPPSQPVTPPSQPVTPPSQPIAAPPAAEADLLTRLAELELIAEQRDLTPEESTQIVGILATLNQQEANGDANQATPVQPGEQAPDAGAAPMAQGPADSGGGLAPAGVTAATGQSEQAQPLSQPADGYVRLYHGGSVDGETARWVTPDLKYAQGYANKSGGAVFYVDVPSDSSYLTKAFDDAGTSVKAPIAAFNAPPEIASQLKPMPKREANQSVPEKGSAQNLSTESTRTPEQVAYARAAAQFNALLPQLKAAKAAGNTVEAERIAMQMREFDIAMKLAEHRQFQQGQKKAETERAATRATELDAKPVGTRMRPSEFPNGNIYVEKQADGSWLGTGAMYEGKTLTSAELGERAMVDMPAANGIAAEQAQKARNQPVVNQQLTTEQPQSTQPAHTDFWTFAKGKGFTPGQIQIGSQLHTELKAEYDALKAGNAAPVLPPMQPQQNVDLQNRDRARAASVVQMSEIARNPDYMRLGPSRTPDSGAPMVFAVGDQLGIEPQNMGREDVAVMSDGQRVPFRYAVVDASTVNPSNFADGRQNPAFASTTPGTLKALNNGRTAGVRAAHEMGTAVDYIGGMKADAAMHGIPADVIARTPNPMLVRLYSDADNTSGMAAKSQGQGLGMSPAELARQDAPLMDSSVLGVYADGDVTSAGNRDFVRAFIGKLQGAGQDVAGMMTGDGQLSQDGRKRIQAALMQAAYGDSSIVEEMFDSTDTDIKAIGEALKAVAGRWANMRDSARLGVINPEVDITQNLLQAIGLIRKARRDSIGLFDLVNQPDLMTGETPDAMTVAVLRLFYSGKYLTRAIGKDKLAQHLGDYMTGAMATSADAGMFGDAVTPGDILATIINQFTQGQGNAETQPTESREQPAGGVTAGRGAGEGGQAVGRPGAAEGRAGSNQNSGSQPGKNAQAEPEQQAGTGNQKAEEGNGATEGRPAGGQQAAADAGKPETVASPAEREADAPLLTAPTAEEVVARQDAAEAAKRKAEADKRRADEEERTRRERADIAQASVAAADTFELGQDPMANLTGQQDIFGAPAEPSADEKAKEKAKADLKDALGDLADIFGKNTRINIVPEQEQKLLPVLSRVMDAAFRLGYLKFKDAAKFALDKISQALGTDVANQITLDHMQGAYIAMAGKYQGQGADTKKAVVNVENRADIENHTAQAVDAKENQDVPGANERVEPDSQKPATEPAVGDSVQADAGGTAPTTGKAGGRATGKTGGGQQGGDGVSTGGTAAGGNRGDFFLPGGNATTDLATVVTGSDFRERGSDIGVDGVSVDPVPATQVDAFAETGNDRLTKEDRQRAAEKVAIKPGDLDNIKATLPYLLEGQQEDVQKTEARFAQPDGYGMLFTNGTGTGKTFTGLGVVKRMQRQGKTNILIVVPDDKIAADWIESGNPLGLRITALKSTKDAGQGIVIASYANLGENDALARRKWDMVVADEAHSLMQSADGKVTTYLANLRAITHHPDGAYRRHRMLYAKEHARMAAVTEQIDANNKIMSNADTMAEMVASVRRENEALEREQKALAAKLRDTLDEVKADVKAMQGPGRARLLALSATPFAYEFTVDWANGYLFDYAEGQTDESKEFRGYNQGSNRDRFFMTHFGYSMRYNKLTKPDASKVDTGLLQRNFNGWLRKKGSLSARMLDVPADYDRRFVLVDSAIGNTIDDALNWISESSREGDNKNGFSALRAVIDEKFDYLSRRYLLEAIKANESVPIVRQHLAMGRKVVVFHDYKKGGGFNPFNIEVPGKAPADFPPDRLADFEAYKAALTEFRSKFKGLVDAPLGQLTSPIEVFKREFPDVLLVNGDEKKSDLLVRYKRFQDDASGPQVMLVQSAKNKGWSGHDATGKHQRVLLNLGQPTAPTLAIQQEGRIYRTGQVTDAIQRYLNTGTNWEKWAFATTIAGRASTAENLGMGEQARALKDSFIAAFEESDAYPPGHEGEGKGGKARDQLANAAISAYDRAKTYYWATQKKNSKTKAQEGADYFATPEPLGFKMAEWLGLRGGESSLEPSGGHGAIARWLPEVTNRTVIEPSNVLRARLAMAMDVGKDRIIDGRFEDHSVVNKYDGIAMNPPFGVGGKLAIEHLAKAVTHLRDGGRIVALIPTGPAADKRFDQWMYGTEERALKPLAQVDYGMGPQDIYRGDTIKSRASWAPQGVVTRKNAEGGFWVKVDGKSGETLVSAQSITSHARTGPRTQTVRPADGIYMVAEIKLPQVTFERAGTAVATRIVVLEKQTDKERFKTSTRNTDLSSITDIKELFDRLEDMAMPERSMTALQEAAAKTEQADADARAADAAKAEKPKADKPKKAANPDAVGTVDRAGAEIVEHVTQKGKTLRGIVRQDLLKEEAQKIDPYTLRKDGGWFIRDVYLKADGDSMMSRGRAGGMAESAVRQVADTISARWDQAPTIVVVPNMQDMRVPEAARNEDARQRAAGAIGVPRGFYDRGTVYLVADGLKSVTDAAEALFHEALGHYGLRAVFGSELLPILDQIAAARPELMRPKAAEYGKDLAFLKQRRQVAEEVLAEMAQTKPSLGYVKRAIAAIRTWLRKNVPAFKDLALTDAEIIQNFILPARGFVERGDMGVQPGSQVALSRSPIKSVTANTDRGLEALAKAVNEKTTVHRAMFRNGLGWVDFVWGDEGAVKPNGRTKGGRGLSHIIEARMRKDGLSERQAIDVMGELIRTIAAGEEFDRKEVDRSVRVGVRHDGYIAWLAKQPGANAWVVTGYEIDPDRAATGRATAAPTTSAASRTRDGEGAGSDDSMNQGGNAGNSMFSRATLGGQPPQHPGPQNTWQKLKAKALQLSSPESITHLIYELQDKHIDLKNLRDHIKALGGTITDLNDAYLGEELYHKRVAKRTQDFLSEELKPLLADLRARGLDLATLERYLHARHAPEANRVLAERNPNAQMIDAGKTKAAADVKALEVQLQRAKAQGSATKAIEQALDMARDELSRWTGVQAFKGTEDERLSLSGMSDTEAASVVANLPAGQAVHLDALAARVDAMNAKTLDTLEKYGLMEKSALDTWRTTYQHYVPLHRDEAHPDSVGHPVGQGFSTKGDASKRRAGSNEKVTNILAHIAMQREAALTRGEKNRVAKKLYLMAAQNPDPEVWTVDKPPMIKSVDRETGFVRSSVDPTYRNKANVVMMRIGGRDHAIVFNERNPIAVRMAESIKGADMGDLNAFDSLMGKATRWLASVNTQYNPIFGVINFTRDVQAALLQLSSTPLAGQERAVASYMLPALRGVYTELRSRRAGQGRGTGEWAKLWEDMQDEGGTTGFRELFVQPDERVKALEKELASLDRGQASEAAHAVVDWLSDYNETMENATRLAAYKVALDNGMSKERAASVAKNITVNFNRKGRQTAKLGAYYAFLNAAIQGTTRMAETLAGPAGRKIMAGGVAIGAINALIAMAMMGAGEDDDNWEKIPGFVKERSLIIPLGREDFLAIPMPLGFHVLPNIGRKAVEMMLHNDPTKGAGVHFAEMLRLVLDAFNPLGGSSNLGQMITPTPFDPAVALMQNRDWTGKQIYREDNSNLDPTPGHTRTKDSASTFSKVVSEALGKISGGTDYQPGAINWTPDQIDFVIGQLTGGLGREAIKLENTITSPFTGDELPPHKIPLVGRVYGNTRGPTSESEKFYENLTKLNGIEREIKGRARNGEDVDAYTSQEPLSDLIGMGNAMQNQISKLKAAKRDVMRRAEPGYRDEAKELGEKAGEAMKMLNQEVRRVKLEAQQ